MKDGIRNAFRSKGRMSRLAFWQFAPLGVALPIAYATQVDWLTIHPWRGMVYLLLLFLLSLPLLNAFCRRLTDAGFDGRQAYYPFAPLVLLWIGYQSVLWLGFLVGLAGGALLVLVLWFFALIVLVPLHIIAFVVSVFISANLIGQALVASEPRPSALTN